MTKLLRCKLGFHHWHYDCKAEFPYFYVEAKCFYCGKEDLITTSGFHNLSVKEWFSYSNNWVWDKHNPASTQNMVKKLSEKASK